MMIENIIQIWIALLGGLAIWLVGRIENWKKWGFVIGLIGQPAWFYTTIKHQQWGMVALSVWYTYAWIEGIYNYFYADKKALN